MSELIIIDKPMLPSQLLRSTAPFITGIRIRNIITKSGTTLRILFAEKKNQLRLISIVNFTNPNANE